MLQMNNSASVFTRIREMKRGREVWKVWEDPPVTSVGQEGGLSSPMTVVVVLSDPPLVSRYWTTESATIIFQPRF